MIAEGFNSRVPDIFLIGGVIYTKSRTPTGLERFIVVPKGAIRKIDIPRVLEADEKNGISQEDRGTPPFVDYELQSGD